jgi:hypothetical protein
MSFSQRLIDEASCVINHWIRRWMPGTEMQITARAVRAVSTTIGLKIFSFFSFQIIGTTDKSPVVLQLACLTFVVLMTNLSSFKFYSNWRGNLPSMALRLTGYLMVILLDDLIYVTSAYLNEPLAAILVNMCALVLYSGVLFSIYQKESQHTKIAEFMKDAAQRLARQTQFVQPLVVGAFLLVAGRKHAKTNYIAMAYFGTLLLLWAIRLHKRGLPIRSDEAGQISLIALGIGIITWVTVILIGVMARRGA